MPVSPDVRVVLDYTCMYLLAFVGPLIPAILIYKFFPDTKTSIGGPLSGLTLKTTGAFAAYVTAFLVTSFILVYFHDDLQSSLTIPTYHVSGKINFVDENGKPLADLRATEGLTVEFSPRLYTLTESSLDFTLPVDGKRQTTVYLNLGERGRVPLDYPFTGQHASTAGRDITLTDPIVMTINTSSYNPNGTAADNGGHQ